jgi:hypothetical protein
MIKKNGINAIIIGTCILVNSMAGVYADTSTTEAPVSIQIQQASSEDELTQKQNEIDRYVFEKHAKDFADKGIIVTNTGVIGEYVEVGIAPFNEENSNYIYEIFGKDKVKVVEGVQAVTLGSVDVPSEVSLQMDIPIEKETSSFVAFFNNIWEWIKNIF